MSCFDLTAQAQASTTELKYIVALTPMEFDTDMESIGEEIFHFENFFLSFLMQIHTTLEMAQIMVKKKEKKYNQQSLELDS